MGNAALQMQVFPCICGQLSEEDRNAIDELHGSEVDESTTCEEGGFNKLKQLLDASASDGSYKGIFDRYREHIDSCLLENLQQCTQSNLCTTEEQMWTQPL